MGAQKHVVGVCVDGTDLKIAVLSREGGTFRIEGLVREVLTRSLEQEGLREEEVPTEEAAAEDAFGFEAEEDLGESIEGEEISNQSILLGLLGKFPLRKWLFAVNMPASKVYYYEFEEDFGLKKRDKIRKRLRQELQSNYQMDVPLDAVDFLQIEEGRILGVVHENGLAVLDFVEGIGSFLHGPLSVTLVDTNEIALMNLVRASYSFSEQEVVAVVYIGDEFSRVLFMRGNTYLSFGGVVDEGRRSSHVLNALFSKILLEQDVSGMPDIDRFLLSGYCGEVEARTFFAHQFPDAQVDYLVPPQLEVADRVGEGEVGNNEQEIAAFAIPIGLAWKALGEKKGTFYDTDFVPKRIRDRQNAYKLAWHAFLVMGLLGAVVVVLIGQWKAQTEAIHGAQHSVRGLEASIAEAETDLASMGSLDSLQSQVRRYEADITFVDTLSRDAQKWSPMLEQLAMQTKELRPIWFERISSRGDLVMLTGRSLYRSRIPQMSQRLGDAVLQSVSTEEIRWSKVEIGRDMYMYEFELGYMFQPDKEREK